jgi:hypothetical protein
VERRHACLHRHATSSPLRIQPLLQLVPAVRLPLPDDRSGLLRDTDTLQPAFRFRLYQSKRLCLERPLGPARPPRQPAVQSKARCLQPTLASIGSMAVSGTAVFVAAIVSELLVVTMFLQTQVSFLWFNLIGCAATVALAVLLSAWRATSSSG